MSPWWAAPLLILALFQGGYGFYLHQRQAGSKLALLLCISGGTALLLAIALWFALSML